jgi:hypothetical protein
MRLYSGRDWFTDVVLQPSSTQVGHTDNRSVTASNNGLDTMTSCKPIRVTTTCAIPTAWLSATKVKQSVKDAQDYHAISAVVELTSSILLIAQHVAALSRCNSGSTSEQHCASLRTALFGRSHASCSRCCHSERHMTCILCSHSPRILAVIVHAKNSSPGGC